MILKTLFLLCASIAPALAAGPSVSGGADGCGNTYFEYECTVKSDNGDGTVWQGTYLVTNDSVTPEPIERLDIGICADKGQRYAWLSLSTGKKPYYSASAQIDITDSQKTFNLMVSLVQDPHRPNSYYWANCKKIK